MFLCNGAKIVVHFVQQMFTQLRILRLQTVLTALDRVLPQIDANVKMSQQKHVIFCFTYLEKERMEESTMF